MSSEMKSDLIRRINMKKKQLLTDLTDEQCEKVVGGVGILDPDRFAGAGAGTQGWFGNGSPPPDGSNNGLDGAGFTPGNTISAGPNTIMVPGRKGD
jgi:hypothetical protein